MFSALFAVALLLFAYLISFGIQGEAINVNTVSDVWRNGFRIPETKAIDLITPYDYTIEDDKENDNIKIPVDSLFLNSESSYEWYSNDQLLSIDSILSMSLDSFYVSSSETFSIELIADNMCYHEDSISIQVLPPPSVFLEIGDGSASMPLLVNLDAHRGQGALYESLRMIGRIITAD